MSTREKRCQWNGICYTSDTAQVIGILGQRVLFISKRCDSDTTSDKGSDGLSEGSSESESLASGLLHSDAVLPEESCRG